MKILRVFFSSSSKDALKNPVVCKGSARSRTDWAPLWRQSRPLVQFLGVSILQRARFSCGLHIRHYDCTKVSRWIFEQPNSAARTSRARVDVFLVSSATGVHMRFKSSLANFFQLHFTSACTRFEWQAIYEPSPGTFLSKPKHTLTNINDKWFDFWKNARTLKLKKRPGKQSMDNSPIAKKWQWL